MGGLIPISHKNNMCAGSKRKHTPITSEAERGLFGSELARRRAGKKGKISSVTTAELESHLHESAGKNLPKRVHGSGVFVQEDFVRGYRKV